MKYEHTPRPLIEEHYHIKMLIEQQDRRAQDRTYYRDKAKDKEDRNDHIKGTQLVCVTDFWCDKCREDFKSMSVREVETDWSNPSQYIAFYKSKCAKGHWCIRLITDKQQDGFWQRSKKVAIDRGSYFADILQPFETGYNMLYGRSK